MSESDRKSMDDVLASIRRIVRSDKPEAGPGDPESETAWAEAEDEPLLLTPEMRTDAPAGAAGALTDDDADAAAEGSLDFRAGPPAPDALHAMIRAILLEELGSGAAGDAVREIIHDELINGEIGGNVSQNVVRLVRDEVTRLTGDR